MTHTSLLHKLLLETLADGHGRTTAHLAEALRAEYPEDFNRIMKAYQGTHSLSGCGILMSALTLVGGALGELAAGGLVIRKYAADGTTLWQTAKNK